MFSWLKRRRLDLDEQEFQDEVRAHLAIGEAERMADGADPQTAHDAALKDFGNVTLTTEAARRVWTPWWLEALRDYASDVRYAIRALAKNPGFSLTVAGVLTLGIGLNAAVFTMIKSLALSPVAGVDGSAQLRVVFAETSAGRALRVSYPDYQYLRDHDQAFSGLMGSTVTPVGLGRGRSARSLWAELVTGNYFQVLGVAAARGRTLLPSDEIAPGAPSGRRVERWPVAARLRRRSGHCRQDRRNQRLPADRRRRGRPGVSRYDRGLRRRSVHPDHDGPRARPQPREPANHGVGRLRRSSRPALLSTGLPAAGHDARERRGADRRALDHARARSAGHRCRGAAAGRAVLANAGRRAVDSAADADHPRRDGSARAADRLRQHRRARAGARRCRGAAKSPCAWRSVRRAPGLSGC